MRTLTTVGLFACFAGVASAQNDECATAMAAVLGTTPFDTSIATLSPEVWPCAGGGGPDLWYTYTAANTNNLRIETCGSTYDTALEIFTGACGALVPVACNDDACGLQSSITIGGVTMGTTYTFRIGGFFGNVGSGSFTITEIVPAANDECATAVPLTLGAPAAFDTAGGSLSPTPWTCANGGAPDVWYSYVATSNNNLRFSNCGSSYDTAIEVYDGTCGSLVSLGCNDLACGLQSELIVGGVSMGTTYYARVGGWSGQTGAGTIVVTEVLPATNQTCATAIQLADSTPVSYDTAGGTAPATPFGCGLNQGPELWYKFTPVQSGVSVRVTTCGSGFDTVLEAFDGSCATLIPVACNDDDCGLQSTLNIPNVSAGTDYYIRVAGYNGSNGMGTIEAIEGQPPVVGCTVNPGFETGDLSGWTLIDNPGPFLPAGVATAGTSPGFGLFATAPTEGSYCFVNGFDGDVGVIELSQVITVTSGLTPLTFEYRAGWDMLLTGLATIDRTFDVVVKSAMTGAVLQTTNILTATANTTNLDTGSVMGSVDLSMFLGQTVRVSFEWNIPEAFTGPGHFQLDNISCPSGGGGVGLAYCGPAVVNSTGMPANLYGSGSASVANNDLELHCENMPVNSFGYFLTSQTQGFSPTPGGSQGNLCLGGQIGRFVGPNQIQNSGAAGQISLLLNLTQQPTPSGFVSVVAGQTWNFTAWYRDAVGMMATSNFANGLEVVFVQ